MKRGLLCLLVLLAAVAPAWADQQPTDLQLLEAKIFHAPTCQLKPGETASVVDPQNRQTPVPTPLKCFSFGVDCASAAVCDNLPPGSVCGQYRDGRDKHCNVVGGGCCGCS